MFVYNNSSAIAVYFELVMELDDVYANAKLLKLRKPTRLNHNLYMYNINMNISG